METIPKGYHYAVFLLNQETIKPMDKATKELGLSRETVILSAIRKFATERKIDIPCDYPIAAPYVMRMQSGSERYRKKYAVCLLLPDDRDSSWFSVLMKETQAESASKLLRQVVTESCACACA